MTEFTGVEGLRLRIGVHAPVEDLTISIHYAPLLTTLPLKGQ
jgi:hypothetical protein